jgi:hypothetical protein
LGVKYIPGDFPRVLANKQLAYIAAPVVVGSREGSNGTKNAD